MKKIFVMIAMVCVLSTAKAQLNFETLLEGNADDAGLLIQNYLEPVFVGAGYGLNSGWYNTAKPHKLFGFDITAGVSFATVPTDARVFTFNNADFNSMSVDGTSAEMPTVFGLNLPADDLPEITFQTGEPLVPEVRATALTGTEIESADWYPFSNPGVPMPFAQFGIGLVKNTEIKLRIAPETTFQDVTLGNFGIGVMHDVKQWIPGMKLLPFDLSAFFGYNSLNLSYALNDAGTQVADIGVSGTTFQVAASKKLAILTVYGGLGFLTSSTNVGINGEFEVTSGTLVDPVQFDYSSGGMRANVGARLKLLVLTLHAEYAVQKYNTLTVGLGISVR